MLTQASQRIPVPRTSARVLLLDARPDATKILLKRRIGDYGVVESRCGCPLAAMRIHRHLRQIRELRADCH